MKKVQKKSYTGIQFNILTNFSLVVVFSPVIEPLLMQLPISPTWQTFFFMHSPTVSNCEGGNRKGVHMKRESKKNRKNKKTSHSSCSIRCCKMCKITATVSEVNQIRTERHAHALEYLQLPWKPSWR